MLWVVLAISPDYSVVVMTHGASKSDASFSGNFTIRMRNSGFQVWDWSADYAVPAGQCYGSVKNGFDSAILTKIPRMKKEEGLGRRQTTKCGAKRQAHTLSQNHATTELHMIIVEGSRHGVAIKTTI
jgi:hypothetical protein